MLAGSVRYNTMDFQRDWRLVPALVHLFKKIDKKSDESAVQGFHDNFNAWMYPVTEGWAHLNQVLTSGHKVDNHTKHVWFVDSEGAEVDAYKQENKRWREKPTLLHFDRVAKDELDKKMATSKNPAGWELTGGIGIGHHVVFQLKILGRQEEPVSSVDGRLLHIWDDAIEFVQFHEWNKKRVLEQIENFGLRVGQAQEAPSSEYFGTGGQDMTYGYDATAFEGTIANTHASPPGVASSSRGEGSSKHKSSSKHVKSSSKSSSDSGWSQWQWAAQYNCYESHKKLEDGTYDYCYSYDKKNLI